MAEIIGRSQELNTLEQALHIVPRVNGYFILLTDEAEIGKNRLIEELEQRASLEKFTILQGKGRLTESHAGHSFTLETKKTLSALK